MERWDEEVREDHHALESQMEALEAAFAIDVAAQDRRVVLSWIIRNLWPTLELHLRKEEEILFPALRQLLGENAGAITLLLEQHRELRRALRNVAELLQGSEFPDWNAIRFAAEALADLLEDHEKKEERLLIDVLQYSLKPDRLRALAKEFHEVAKRAHAEEGWPAAAWWKNKGGKR